MKYAKWVRPLAFLALFSAMKLVLVQLRLVMLLVAEPAGEDEAVFLRAMSAAVQVGLAEAALALCVAFGLQIFLTGLAWHSVDRGLLSLASQFVGLLMIAGAVFLLFV